MKCLIVDDEPLAVNLFSRYINQNTALELAGMASNALEAFQMLNDRQVDLMFLDIRMPGISGLDFLKSLKNPPMTILTSAYNEYAVEGFELEVADYLLKPVTYERFEKSIAKILRRENTEIKKEPDYTYFKVSRELVKVEHKDLLYIRSIKDYVLIKTTLGDHIVYMTMNYLEEALPTARFCRIHRSYIVNLDFVTVVKKNALILSGQELPVSESYKRSLTEKLS